MFRKLASSHLFRGVVITLLIAQLVYHFWFPKHKCSDLTFDLLHPNRTVTVTALNPDDTYSDLLTFTYHQRLDLLSLNNANCQLQIGNVDGMTRTQLQYLKPYIIKDVIKRSRSPHVGYVDWDANFIRRPWNPPTDLIVLSNPEANSTNTGFLLFFNKDKYINTIDAWIEQETPKSHDQWTWALMERATNIPVYRTADGEFGEGYNWNTRNKRNTTARCAGVITHLTWFRPLLTMGVVLFVLVKFHDLWSSYSKNHTPKRGFLTTVFILAVLLSVFFKEQYHQQRGYEKRFFGERICGVPEVSLLEDGSIVSRQDTTTAPNPFFAMVIRIVGLDLVSTFTSFWFSLLERMRSLARVVLIMELVSLGFVVLTRKWRRMDGWLWCTMVSWRDAGNGKMIKRFWKDDLMDGEDGVDMEMVGKGDR